MNDIISMGELKDCLYICDASICGGPIQMWVVVAAAIGSFCCSEYECVGEHAFYIGCGSSFSLHAVLYETGDVHILGILRVDHVLLHILKINIYLLKWEECGRMDQIREGSVGFKDSS